MLKLFAPQQCVCCGKQTRIPFLRMWVYFKVQGKLYCSDACILEHGRMLQRNRLKALAELADAILDDAELQMSAMRGLTVKSREALAELESVQRRMITISQQLQQVK